MFGNVSNGGRKKMNHVVCVWTRRFKICVEQTDGWYMSVVSAGATFSDYRVIWFKIHIQICLSGASNTFRMRLICLDILKHTERGFWYGTACAHCLNFKSLRCWLGCECSVKLSVCWEWREQTGAEPSEVPQMQQKDPPDGWGSRGVCRRAWVVLGHRPGLDQP